LIPLLFLVLAADPLAGILAQMDSTAATFKGAKAGLKQISHNAAVDINTEKGGTMLLKRPAPNDVRTLIDFTQPDPQQVFIGNGILQIYYPKINTIQEYKLDAKNQLLFQQFYLLAFGGSGKDLAANYDITYLGSDPVEGAKCSHLQLLPKDPEVRKKVTKIELWLAEAKAIPAQFRLSLPGGDTTTFVYSDVIMNPKISDSDLKLRTSKGVHIQHPAQ
jgi:outer membrane lipoprotein-sorting protein